MNIDKPLLIALIILQLTFTILVLCLPKKPRTAIHMSPYPISETNGVSLKTDAFHHQMDSSGVYIMLNGPSDKYRPQGETRK